MFCIDVWTMNNARVGNLGLTDNQGTATPHGLSWCSSVPYFLHLGIYLDLHPSYWVVNNQTTAQFCTGFVPQSHTIHGFWTTYYLGSTPKYHVFRHYHILYSVLMVLWMILSPLYSHGSSLPFCVLKSIIDLYILSCIDSTASPLLLLKIPIFWRTNPPFIA